MILQSDEAMGVVVSRVCGTGDLRKGEAMTEEELVWSVSLGGEHSHSVCGHVLSLDCRSVWCQISA